MKRNLRSERGQAIILIIFSILGLIGITALAVDGGTSYADRRQAQNAADSAVLAAALARIRGGDYQAAVLSGAQDYGYNNDGVRSVVQVNVPPVSGPYAGKSEYIQVIITSHHKTYFGSVIGIDELTNTVEAVARAKPPEWKQIMNGYAVISLSPDSDCLSEKAFWLHGQATLSLEGGGLFVNSNNRTCAFHQQGTGSLVMMDTSPVSVVGGATITKLDLIKRLTYADFANKGKPGWDRGRPFLPATGSTPVSYPPPFVLPKPGCGAKMAEVSRNGTNMSPGNWEEDFPPDGVTDLDGGVYCINGDVRIRANTTLRGSNVVLYVEHGSVRFDGNATIQLGAPTSGPFKGLLLYLPMKNHNRVILNGNVDSTFRGTILAPASLIRITGNQSTYGFHSQIIGFRVELDGDSQIIVRYLDEQNYDALISPEIQFNQ